MSDPEGAVRLEVDGAVATITIDRPAKLNAMTLSMDRAMNDIAFAINGDDAVRSVVLIGAGERAFSAGSDITNLEGYGNNWQQRNRTARRLDYALAVLGIRKPVVAAVRGYVVGGGLEMACAADIRVGSETAQFGAGEIRWGWHGGSGATQLLTRVVGPGKALELLLTGDRIDAQEAYRIGLIQRLVPDAELESTARSLAERIASRSPIATQSVKNLVRVAQGASLDIGLAYENDMFGYCMTTRDAAEGMAAFAEKREPVFRGE